MRSYDDISERVFRKGDKILEKRRKRTAVIKKISFSVSGICAVILVGFGVWTNDCIKHQTNSLLNDNQNNQIITENETDSERNKESMSQTSTTEYKNNRTYLSETVTSTEVSDVFLSTTISADNGFSENIIYTTTVTNQIFSVNTTEIQTEHIPETVQTTVSTTVQTNTMETEITNPPQNIDDERSFYMKKFTSFISALTIMSSVMPTTSNASGVPFKVNPERYWPGEKAIFAKMESGEL
ncbi:MAG: hypothetical protein K2F73_06480, partial [Ruminococcus sp.]|nr:hypothetical protein [Ruminococcus sp.]